MNTEIFTQAAQLGGTVFTVIAFLWYLSKRDDKWTDSLKQNMDNNVLLAKALQRLTDMVEINTSTSFANTSKITENVDAVQGNTEEMKKNTEIIHKTNGKSK